MGWLRSQYTPNIDKPRRQHLVKSVTISCSLQLLGAGISSPSPNLGRFVTEHAPVCTVYCTSFRLVPLTRSYQSSSLCSWSFLGCIQLFALTWPIYWVGRHGAITLDSVTRVIERLHPKCSMKVAIAPAPRRTRTYGLRLFEETDSCIPIASVTQTLWLRECLL